MANKIMIDSGRGGRVLCTGEREPAQAAPVMQIGRALCQSLQSMGYKTLFSQDVPSLTCEGAERGRPALCASVAREWGADCLLRLCVREAELPTVGRAVATVHRTDRRARALAEQILRRIDLGSELNADAGVHTASSILLLRRTPCTGILLVLQLPFSQMDSFTPDLATLYATCISEAFDGWEG